MAESTPLVASVTLCAIISVLSLNIVNGLVFDSTTLAVPAQLKIIAPGDTAAAINSGLLFIGACVNLLSPIIGRISDRYGRRPVLLASAFIDAVAAAILIASVRLATPPLDPRTPPPPALPPPTPPPLGWDALDLASGEPLPACACGASALPPTRMLGLVLFLIGYVLLTLGLTMLGT